MNVAEAMRTVWESGFVNRWHSHPDPRLRNSGDTTAAHAQRVAVLVILLGDQSPDPAIDPSGADLLHALLHDAPECVTGDVPGPSKAIYGFDKALSAAENVWFASVGFYPPEKTTLLALCDLLDAIMFCRHVAPDLISSPPWRNDIARAVEMAGEMGVREIVMGLLGVKYDA